jgi:hypothetical protein
MTAPAPGDSWGRTLDRIEADLAAIDEALANGLLAPAAVAIALPSEPLPSDLGPRAEALLRRTQRLESRATHEIDGIQDALRALAGRRPPPATNTGRIVDVDA